MSIDQFRAIFRQQNPRRCISRSLASPGRGALFRLVTNIYQISILTPNTNPERPRVCRVVVAMMGKLHLQVIRDICIRLYIE